MRRMYLVQMKRPRRLCEFIASDERFKSLDFHLQVDIILSFFIHCYHMADWLKGSGVSSAKIYNYIQNTYELQVCRDLTNGTKHLDLCNPRTSVFDFKSLFTSISDTLPYVSMFPSNMIFPSFNSQHDLLQPFIKLPCRF